VEGIVTLTLVGNKYSYTYMYHVIGIIKIKCLIYGKLTHQTLCEAIFCVTSVRIHMKDIFVSKIIQISYFL